MKLGVFFLFFLITIKSNGQELIENFAALSDSAKNLEVTKLLVANRADTSITGQIETLHEVAAFCRSKNDLPTEGLAAVYLYALHIDLGAYKEAEKVGTIIDQKFYDHLLPRNQLGYTIYKTDPLMFQGKFDEALEGAHECLAISEEHGFTKTNAYSLISAIYSQMGKEEQALANNKNCLTYIIENFPQDSTALGQTYFNISNNFYHLDQMDSAMYYNLLADRYFTNPSVTLQMGSIEIVRENYDKARVYFEEAEQAILSNPRWRWLKKPLYLSLSQLEELDGNWEGAASYSEKVIAISAQENDAINLRHGYRNVIRSMLKEKAYYLDSLTAQEDKLRDQNVAEATIEIETKYETAEKEKEILALNGQVKDERIKTLQFQTYLLYAGLIALFVIGIIYLISRVRRIRNLREIENLRKQALQLQMNPHFFFNSLNSIHKFIATNETSEAQRYLVNFSKLMRLTLENSQNDLIPIQKEIEFLENFLTLEQLRKKNFDFEIKMDDRLENTKIPSLLVQPLIENSVLHGFSEIDYRGKIEIAFTQNNNEIIVSVTDNGIGRDKSMAIKGSGDSDNHKSFATKLLTKRIAIYGSQKNTSISFKNGFSENGNPGTQVAFTLPINR